MIPRSEDGMREVRHVPAPPAAVGRVPDIELPDAYGCVEWFDYEAHAGACASRPADAHVVPRHA